MDVLNKFKGFDLAFEDSSLWNKPYDFFGN